jgi:hypothetical protein
MDDPKPPLPPSPKPPMPGPHPPLPPGRGGLLSNGKPASSCATATASRACVCLSRGRAGAKIGGEGAQEKSLGNLMLGLSVGQVAGTRD